MKILVIGESNSVMSDGWVSAFSSFENVDISNQSIGSTGIFNAIRVLKTFDASRFDLIIFDSFINDSDFFLEDLMLYRHLLISVFSSFKSKYHCNLAFIVFERYYPNSIKLVSFKSILIEVCSQFGVFVFETRKLLENIASNNNINLADLYDDASHPLKSVSYDLGLAFYQQVEDFLSENFIKIEVEGVFEECLFYCDTSGFIAHDSVEFRHLRNSLIDFKSAFIKKDQWVDIYLKHPLMMPIGFFFNSASSSGVLAISSDNCLYKNVSSANFNAHGKLIWARPIKKMIFSVGSKIFRFSSSGGYYTEDTEHCLKSNVPLFSESSLDLISVIFVDLVKLFGHNYSDWISYKYLEDSNLSSLNMDSLYRMQNFCLDFLSGLSARKNFALNCLASQSSLSVHSTESDAMGGCNGIKNGRFGFHTDLEINPWWCLDLSVEIEFELIVIYNRTNSCSDRIRNLNVSVSLDNINWTNIYCHTGRPAFGGVGTFPYNPPLLLFYPNKIKARYIRVQLLDYEILHLDEVEVY